MKETEIKEGPQPYGPLPYLPTADAKPGTVVRDGDALAIATPLPPHYSTPPGVQVPDLSKLHSRDLPIQTLPMADIAAIVMQNPPPQAMRFTEVAHWEARSADLRDMTAEALPITLHLSQESVDMLRKAVGLLLIKLDVQCAVWISEAMQADIDRAKMLLQMLPIFTDAAGAAGNEGGAE